MKRIFLISIVTAFSVWSVSAQKKGPSNRFDTTYAKKNEISVAIGMFKGGGGFPFGNYNEGNGPYLSVQYAHVYKANHFLRAGMQVGASSINQRPHYFLPASPTVGDGQPDVYTKQRLALHNNISNTYAGAFIGYEYGVGVRRFRFTFGADLRLGFNRRKISTREDAYLESRTYDPVTDLYQYNLQFLHTGKVTGSSNNVFVSLVPRIGIRRELGKRIALALTFTPEVGFSQRVRYSEKVEGTMPSRYFNPKSAWFVQQGAEVRLIVKLGQK